MTTELRNRRIQAVKLADALNAIEGVPVSSYAQTLSQCWVREEMTSEQMKEALYVYHRRLASMEKQM